ncbi:4-alpha-glucanotransferase [Formivibrio citricus]|uniref:4-alpha-glucanotransferase n=1 Tax=Formivibrio citricus TaxID=83765 RepID=A0A1I5BI21_9NEIS|nr:4-alpha-glucanotransferase [Formivibrio citricus]SFN74394.1 4-alpha-glucanotransferase [Formivibrio citricus]
MPANSTPLFNWLQHRAAGVLLHPTSFPGAQGSGVLDDAVTRWLDFLADSGIRYWQVCPLGPTGFGDSPYQCFSAFAGNPYLINLVALQEHGLLDAADLLPLAELPQEHVDFGELYLRKWPVLFKAFHAFAQAGYGGLPYGNYPAFKEAHRDWLMPYCLFLALKAHHGGLPWWQWPEEQRFLHRVDLAQLPASVTECAEAHAFFQYLFFGQWQQVRAQAKARGIEIIGDAPIFVAPDSADVWSRPELFRIDPQTGQPQCVAGVPPDYFSANGQLWGNPLYDWEAHARDGFSWWRKRLRANFELCDVLRIDHFRAFDTYWAIPADALSAKTGCWENGPGLAFFAAVAREFPLARLIAEDLGDLLPSVHDLRHATGLPGMAILQFAFGGDADNDYLPHNLTANCVVYPGTHDNDTTRGWYAHADEKVRDHVRRYLRVSGEDIAWDFIRTAYESVCKLAIIPLQDLLALDSNARFNTPGVAQGNWQWRYSAGQLENLHRQSAVSLRELGELYGRVVLDCNDKSR